ncbi:hypothetical protein V1522DRAFT_407469, partial [Lipomyces starkeyi]
MREVPGSIPVLSIVFLALSFRSVCFSLAWIAWICRVYRSDTTTSLLSWVLFRFAWAAMYFIIGGSIGVKVRFGPKLLPLISEQTSHTF